MAAWLLAAGGAIYVVLGALHALYTFTDIARPRRIVPDDPALIAAMQASGVRLARGGTTMWRAWVGFNFSHSLGAVVFGAGCIAAAWCLLPLAPARAVLAIPVAVSALYLVLAIRYWFRIPVGGTAIATASFALAWLAY